MLKNLNKLRKPLFFLVIGIHLSLLQAGDCQQEIEAFSAVSKSFGRQQEVIHRLLTQYFSVKSQDLKNYKMTSAQEIDTSKLTNFIKNYYLGEAEVYLHAATAKLTRFDLDVLKYRHQLELCFGKIKRSEAVKAHMEGYKSGEAIIKRAYGLDKLDLKLK